MKSYKTKIVCLKIEIPDFTQKVNIVIILEASFIWLHSDKSTSRSRNSLQDREDNMQSARCIYARFSSLVNR